MSTSAAPSILDWRGDVDVLLDALRDSAASARVLVSVVTPRGEESLGEIHVVAGGIAGAVADDLRDDDALALIRKNAPLRFRIEPRLPHPDSGGLAPPGSPEGRLDERPLPDLMRYCEDFVFSGTVEATRGEERAQIAYLRGELATTTIDGKEADDRLPDVLAWQDGTFRLVLAPPTLPPAALIGVPVMELADVEPEPEPEQITTHAEATPPDLGPPAAQTPARTPLAAIALAKLPARTPVRPGTVLGFEPSGGGEDAAPAVAIPAETQPIAAPPQPGRTSPGMPVDLRDPPKPERTTEVGMPIVAAPPGAAPSAAVTPAGASTPPPVPLHARKTPPMGAPVTGLHPTPATPTGVTVRAAARGRPRAETPAAGSLAHAGRATSKVRILTPSPDAPATRLAVAAAGPGPTGSSQPGAAPVGTPTPTQALTRMGHAPTDEVPTLPHAAAPAPAPGPARTRLGSAEAPGSTERPVARAPLPQAPPRAAAPIPPHGMPAAAPGAPRAAVPDRLPPRPKYGSAALGQAPPARPGRGIPQRPRPDAAAARAPSDRRARRDSGPRGRSRRELPIGAYVAFGVLLGAAVVMAYWLVNGGL